MAETITGDFVKDAVVRRIAENFDDAVIYTEKKEQGLKVPCFFLLETNVLQSKRQKGVSERIYNITVRWIPDDDSLRKYEDCARTGNLLSEVLETINTGESITHGTGIQYEIIQNVLYFYVNYKVRMIKEKETDPQMKEAEIKTEHKED